jgi:UPF0755 protein
MGMHSARPVQCGDLHRLFIPNTYEFWWTTTAEQFIERMGKEHAPFWNAERKAKAKALQAFAVEVSHVGIHRSSRNREALDAPRRSLVFISTDFGSACRLQADPTLKFALGLGQHQPCAA